MFMIVLVHVHLWRRRRDATNSTSNSTPPSSLLPLLALGAWSFVAGNGWRNGGHGNYVDKTMVCCVVVCYDEHIRIAEE